MKQRLYKKQKLKEDFMVIEFMEVLTVLKL